MTDTALRQAERRAAASGTPEDRAALLRAQVRAGEIRPVVCGKCNGTGRREGLLSLRLACPTCHGTGQGDKMARIRVAAYLGCEGARLLVDPERDIWPWPGALNALDWGVWLRTFQRLAEQAGMDVQGLMVRAAVSAGWVALPVWEAAKGFEQRDGVFTKVRERTIDPWRAAAPRRALMCAEAWLERQDAERRDAWQLACDALPNDARPWSVFPALETDLLRLGIQSAAKLAGDTSVRQAIRERCVEWVLYDRDAVD